MTATHEPKRTPLVTSGTASWERAGADAEHAALAGFLDEVAATETIRTAIDRALAAMRIEPGDSVLDVGCGTGAFFPSLAAAVGPRGRVTGLDHAAGFLADARRRAIDGRFAERLRLIRADAHRLPFPDGSFAAAHTERVLIHLAEPDLALRELRRVVRPGGWVVCVEPDLAGLRLDSSDALAAERIVAGFCASIRNPAMGLELNRRMANAGLLDRRVEVLTEVERAFDEDTAGFFARAAETAIAQGSLDRARATAALTAFQAAGDSGTYLSYSSMFIVAGRVSADG
jgi:SAM-dependent methyltransferase